MKTPDLIHMQVSCFILIKKKKRFPISSQMLFSRQTDDRESKRDTPEEGELRDHRMEITIRNSPYTREDSTEDRSHDTLVNINDGFV